MSTQHTPIDSVIGDNGELIEMFDVTDGQNPGAVEQLVAWQRSYFPERAFVPGEIAIDASLPSRRGGLRVCQWYWTVDGQPASFHLCDLNHLRGIHTVKWAAIEKQFRRLTVGGRRLNLWLADSTRRQAIAELGTEWLGSIALTYVSSLPVLLQSGWKVLPIANFRDPIHGAYWRTLGLENEHQAVIWLPPDDYDEGQVKEESFRICNRAAAALLLDVYDLDTSIDWVAELCGDEIYRPRAQREP